MKILLFTQWFDPEPTPKGLEFAKSLSSRGHKVEVLTGFPNYPGGKVYDGFKIKPYQKDIIDGITIHRVALYPDHSISPIKRIFNYASFAITSVIFGIFVMKKIDIIYGYHPPLTTVMSASLISLIRKIPLVIDIQDLWPDTLASTGMLKNKLALSFVDKICISVYKRASRIIVLSPGFKTKLIDRGVQTDKVEVIYNWCNESAIDNFYNSSQKLPSNGALNLLFAGNLGSAQGMPAIINAAKIINDSLLEVNFVFLGDGIAKSDAIQQSKDLNLTNTFFLSRVPMNEVGSIISKADMLLVHLNDEELFKITIPSRTQAYLAMGKPIIMGVKGDAADLIIKSGAGVLAEPNSPKSLAKAIKKLAKMTNAERNELGAKGRKFYYNELSLNIGVKKFIKIFESCI